MRLLHFTTRDTVVSTIGVLDDSKAIGEGKKRSKVQYCSRPSRGISHESTQPSEDAYVHSEGRLASAMMHSL